MRDSPHRCHDARHPAVLEGGVRATDFGTDGVLRRGTRSVMSATSLETQDYGQIV